MSLESEKQPVNGFDVVLIGEQLKDWDLSILTDDETGLKSWYYSKLTPDGKLLVLGMNPSKRYVNFREMTPNKFGARELSASITCKDIKHVDASAEEITFSGNVDYAVSFNGRFHSLSLPFANLMETIASISYDF